jgi:hypothetical protein
VVLQVGGRAAAVVRHRTRRGRHAMWTAGMWDEEGQERAAKRDCVLLTFVLVTPNLGLGMRRRTRRILPSFLSDATRHTALLFFVDTEGLPISRSFDDVSAGRARCR